jgi:dihydrofolate reductase
MTSLRIILARAANGVIGRAGQLPWRLPADLAHFKQTTMGHPIIMGRTTWLSIGRPLPGRTNIIVSRTLTDVPSGCHVVNSFAAARQRVESVPIAFVIGGAAVYEAAMPFVDTVHLTQIEASIDGDVTFDFARDAFELASCERREADAANPYAMRFERWDRLPHTK